MDMKLWKKPSFSVAGIEGSTDDGYGFIQKLWALANERFDEIKHIVKFDDSGAPLALWGAMSDFPRDFAPWRDGFSRGLYLAGAECVDGAVAPEGWTIWTLPGFEFAMVSADAPDAFQNGLKLITERGYKLIAAAQDYTCPATGKNYICFPVSRL